MTLLWLARRLTEHGYVVAAVNHHGNTGDEPKYDARGFRLFWERPRDISMAIDRVLHDPMFAGKIDARRIGVAGFSLGGYTVIALGGGIVDIARLEEFCQSPQRDFTCEPQQEFPDAASQFEALAKTDPYVQESIRHASDSYRDNRIRAVFAIAPVLANAFPEKSLGGISVPVAIVVGDADRVAPAATNASLFARRIPNAKLSVLPGGVGHYTFLAQCTEFGVREVPICKDEQGVDRGRIHEQVANQAIAFFDRALQIRR